MRYRVTCPFCGGEIRHRVKPRWPTPRATPGLLNEDPYGAGWIVRLKLTAQGIHCGGMR